MNHDNWLCTLFTHLEIKYLSYFSISLPTPYVPSIRPQSTMSTNATSPFTIGQEARRRSIQSTENLMKIMSQQAMLNSSAIEPLEQETSKERTSPSSFQTRRHSIAADDMIEVSLGSLNDSFIKKAKVCELTESEKLNLLLSVKIFQLLSETQIRKLAQELKTEQFTAGDTIVRHNTVGENFYMISDGACAIVKPTLNTLGILSTSKVATMGKGNCFGEVALLTNAPWLASVVADTSCTLLTLQKSYFEKCFVGSKATQMRNEKHHVIKHCILDSISIFKCLSPLEKSKILGLMRKVRFEKEHCICRAGERGDMLFIVVSGEVRCFTVEELEEVDVEKFYPNDFFGEVALLDPDFMLTANYVAVTPVECLFLHRSHLNAVPRLLGRMGIESVCQRFGETLLEEKYDTYADVDVVLEEHTSSKKSSDMASVASLLLRRQKRATIGPSNVAGVALFSKLQRAKVNLKAQREAEESSLYYKLFMKYHNSPQLLREHGNVIKCIDFLDRRNGVSSLREICWKILKKIPKTRTNEEVRCIYTMLDGLQFWSILCKGASKSAKLRLCKKMMFHRLQDGESGGYVYRTGEVANAVYVLLQGCLGIFKNTHETGISCTNKATTTLSPGSCFGMMSVLNPAILKRSESCKILETSMTECVLVPECILIKKEDYNIEIEGEIENSKSLTLSQMYNVLHRTPPFAICWDWFSTYKATPYFTSATLPKGSILYHQGHPSPVLYIIVSGTVRLMVDPRIHNGNMENDTAGKDAVTIQKRLKYLMCVSEVNGYEALGQSSLFQNTAHRDSVTHERDDLEMSMAICGTEVTCLKLKGKYNKAIGADTVRALRDLHHVRAAFHVRRLNELIYSNRTIHGKFVDKESVSTVFKPPVLSPGMVHEMNKTAQEKNKGYPGEMFELSHMPIRYGKVLGGADDDSIKTRTRSWQTPFGKSLKQSTSILPDLVAASNATSSVVQEESPEKQRQRLVSVFSGMVD